MTDTPIADLPVWARFWTVWAIALAIVLVVFLVVEGMALFGGVNGGTLSETVWYLRNKGHWLYYFILDVVLIVSVTMAWLLFHFRFQGGT